MVSTKYSNDISNLPEHWDKVVAFPMQVMAVTDAGVLCKCMLTSKVFQNRRFDHSKFTDGMESGGFYTMKIQSRVGVAQYIITPGITPRQKKMFLENKN